MKKLIIGITFGSLQAASFSSWKGDQLYKKGELEKARASYEEAVMRHPDDMEALYKVGKTAYTRKDYSAAIQAFEKVARSDKSSPSLKEYASFNKGDSFLSQHHYESALKAYQEVLALNPTNEHAQKRIELTKKLMEEQKQKEEQERKEQDKNKKETQDKEQEKKDKNSENNKDKQSSKKDANKNEGKKEDQKSESQKGSQEENQKDKGEQEQRKHDGTDSNEGKGSKHDNPSDREEQSDVDNTEHPQEEERGQNDGQDSQKRPPEKKSDSSGQGTENKPGDTELSKDQKDDTSDTTAHAAEKSIAEEQLTDQEKRFLEQVEKSDRQAQRVLIRRAMPTKPEHDGTKNW